ncbi:MAG TPA: HD domain-containing phosphohydrolase, partial [bacterium]|nr:HD domain-containing phosphohydrolase [bacterium]
AAKVAARAVEAEPAAADPARAKAAPPKDTKAKKPVSAPRSGSAADPSIRPINSVIGRQTSPERHRERLAAWAESAARAIGCEEAEVLDVKRAALLNGVDTAGRETPPGVTMILKHRAERWDGAGAPDRLQGDAIPLGARILGVAIAYSDMITGGPGGPMLYYLDAKAQLRRLAGAQFDPEVVQVFCRVVDRG